MCSCWCCFLVVLGFVGLLILLDVFLLSLLRRFLFFLLIGGVVLGIECGIVLLGFVVGVMEGVLEVIGIVEFRVVNLFMICCGVVEVLVVL